MLGASGVGKTTLVHRLASKDCGSELTPSSLMGDYLERVAVVANETQLVKLQLWDTASQCKFGGAAALPKAYYRHARGAVLVYDATSRASFDEVLSTWLAPLEDLYNGCAFSLTLVATKCDRERQVTPEDGERLAALLGADRYFEVSTTSSARAVDECVRGIAESVAASTTWSICMSAVAAARTQLRANRMREAAATAAAPATPVECPAPAPSVLTAAKHLTIVTTVRIAEPEPEELEGLWFETRKLRSPSVHATARDALASSSALAAIWSQLLQTHSVERKVLVGSTALLLSVPIVLLLLLVLSALHGSTGIGIGISGSVAIEWLERLGEACSSLAVSSGV